MALLKPAKQMTNAYSSQADNSKQPSSYYVEAKDWYHEKYELITISRNRYQLLSIGLGVLLGCSLLALSMMMPLKKYVYRMIEVNQQTGEVSELKEIEGKRYASNWVVTRYFLNQYILNRHLYHHDDIKRTFNLALAMSAKPIASQLTDEILDTNPKSPLNIYGSHFYRDVKVLGINQLNGNTAIVRFKIMVKNQNNKSDIKEKNMQAVIKWKYVDHAASLTDRDQNPLGFFVNYYQESPVYAENN